MIITSSIKVIRLVSWPGPLVSDFKPGLSGRNPRVGRAMEVLRNLPCLSALTPASGSVSIASTTPKDS